MGSLNCICNRFCCKSKNMCALFLMSYFPFRDTFLLLSPSFFFYIRVYACTTHHSVFLLFLFWIVALLVVVHSFCFLFYLTFHQCKDLLGFSFFFKLALRAFEMLLCFPMRNLIEIGFLFSRLLNMSLAYIF
jgi:hypothetical protein